jgi:hypothetical protein
MGEIFVWDLTENLDIVERFGKRVNKAFRPKKKEVNNFSYYSVHFPKNQTKHK